MAAIAPFRGVRGGSRDPVPALYRYEVSFGPPPVGPLETRRHASGFLALLAVGPGLSGGESSDGDLPVLRYADARGWVDEVLRSNAFEEVVRLTDDEGAEHRLWRVDRREGVEEVVAQFEDRSLRVEAGGALLRQAAGGALLVLLAPEGPEPAPWRSGLVRALADEPVPRPWTERAGGPGPAQWRRPPL